MARKLRVEIDGDSKSGRKALGDVATESEVTAKAVDDLADQFREASRAGSRLDRQLGELRRDLAKTAAEFEKTGDAAALKKLRLSTAELSKQEGVRKKLVNLSEEHEKSSNRLAKSLKEVASIGGGGLSESLKQLSGLSGIAGPVGTGVLIAGAAAAAPVALAAGGGAVLAGGALGAVGGGIAGAAMGPQGAMVTDAWDKALDHVKARFLDSTTAWVNPTLDSIGELDRAFKDVPIEGIFKDSLKYLEPLTTGLAGLLTGTAGGLDDLIRAAGPVVDVLSKKLPELGDDFGDSLRIIGEGAPGAAHALGDVLDIVGGLTKAFAGAAAGAGMLYEKAINTPVLKQGHDLFMSFFDFKDLPQGAAKALGTVSDAYGGVVISAEDAKAAVDALTTAFNHQYDVAIGNLDATVAWEAAVDNLTGGWHKQKDALDAGSESGRKNIDLVRGGIAAAKEGYEAAIRSGDGTKLAAAKASLAYQDQVKNLEDMLVKLGVSRDAAHAFLVEFGKIDGQVATTSIVTRHIDQFLPPGVSLGNLTHHAAGGVMDTSGFKLVGEKGPEIVWGSKGQFVSTAEQTKRVVAQMSGGGASGSGRASGQLTLVAGPGAASNPLAQLFMQALAAGQIQMFDSTGQQVRARP